MGSSALWRDSRIIRRARAPQRQVWRATAELECLFCGSTGNDWNCAGELINAGPRSVRRIRQCQTAEHDVRLKDAVCGMRANNATRIGQAKSQP